MALHCCEPLNDFNLNAHNTHPSVRTSPNLSRMARPFVVGIPSTLVSTYLALVTALKSSLQHERIDDLRVAQSHHQRSPTLVPERLMLRSQTSVFFRSQVVSLNWVVERATVVKTVSEKNRNG